MINLRFIVTFRSTSGRLAESHQKASSLTLTPSARVRPTRLTSSISSQFSFTMLATQTVSAVPQLSSLYDSIIDSPSSEPTRQLHQRIVARRQPSSGAMNGQNPTLGGNGLTVKATYNYQAEDSSNLSFRRGDIIRVITRLDSGWWDGTLNGTRGWFPSNYCTIVTGQEATDRDAGSCDPETDFDFEEESDLTSGASEDESGSDNGLRPRVSNDEAAAAWIPQATPDGRLFYCNTVTGDTRADLPLEAPLASDEVSPWERGDVRIPTRSRPPPEMLAGGMERETSDGEYDDLTSASEQEGGGRNGHGGVSYFDLCYLQVDQGVNK